MKAIKNIKFRFEFIYSIPCYRFLLTVLFFGVSLSTLAQNINGIVKNSSGQPISNALVYNATNANSYTKTSANGSFTIAGSTATKLNVAAFKYETKRNITVTSTSNFAIQLNTDPQLSGLIYHNDVDFVRPGLYTKPECYVDFSTYFANGFKKTGSTRETTDRVTIDNANSSSLNGKSIKIWYPPGQVDSKPSGAQWQTDLNGEYSELYLSYKVKFASDFDFTLGGKLPGLAGSTDYGSSNKEWSGKLMWRENGKAEFYMHVSNSSLKSYDWILNNTHTSFKKGVWQEIQIHYKLNTPGQNNGLMEAWLDGQLVGRYANINIFRKAGDQDIFINNLFFSTFYGGNDSYAPTKNEYAWFDEFKVSTSKIANSTSNNTPTNTPPVVNFTNSSSFTAPASIVVKVNATDSDTNDSITNVKLYINTTLVSQDNSFPYEWNTSNNVTVLTNLASGIYTLKAIATDSNGAITEKIQAVTVTSTTNPCAGVNNPVVNITNPANNANFNQGQNVTLNATASSTVNITRVEFYDGTSLVGTDTSSPYSYSSSSLTVGSHNFTAKAYSDCNKTATSVAKTIIIKSVVTPPPSSGPISGPSCGSPMQALTFELSAQQKVNATSYNWYFRGAKQSLITNANGYSCTVVPTRGNGEICVGVRYSSGTSYVEYCKTITTCAARNAIEDTNRKNKLTVYPNPSKDGQFNIELETSQNVSIKILDILGHQIFDYSFKNESERFIKNLDLSKVEKGIYFLNVSYDGNLNSSRLIIE